MNKTFLPYLDHVGFLLIDVSAPPRLTHLHDLLRALADEQVGVAPDASPQLRGGLNTSHGRGIQNVERFQQTNGRTKIRAEVRKNPAASYDARE